jgi:hypothetical protein
MHPRLLSKIEREFTYSCVSTSRTAHEVLRDRLCVSSTRPQRISEIALFCVSTRTAHEILEVRFMSIQERSEIHLSEIAYSRGSTMTVYEILLDGSRSCPQHECSEIRISKIGYLHTRVHYERLRNSPRSLLRVHRGPLPKSHEIVCQMTMLRTHRGPPFPSLESIL